VSVILVIDDEPADLNLVRRALEKLDHTVIAAESARQAMAALRKHPVDVVVCDILLPDGDGLEVLRKIREHDEHLPVILMTSSSDSGLAIRAMKLGALDYLLKPLDVGEMREVVGRALQIRRLTEAPVEINADRAESPQHAIIGRCAAMQEVYKSIGIVAAQDVTVLIRGESGTGKELVARALYQYGERVQGPFLAVNCAAIPEALLESELFGHEKGAFTSADRKRIGKFEQCNGGSLFLDEIGDMSPVLQSKLLRVLQEKQFERVGGNETIKADVRVIAATHQNLEAMVAKGEFRADLYYRLNGFSIHLPPLRDRGADLEVLINHFRRHACNDLNKEVQVISPEAMRRLKGYRWPGNIRELQNAVRQAILKTPGPVLLPEFLPDFVCVPTEDSNGTRQNFPIDSALDSEESKATASSVKKSGAESNGSVHSQIDKYFDSPNLYDDVIGSVEQDLVERILKSTDGDKVEAARRLGINPALMRSRAALELLDLENLHENGHATPLIRPDMTLAEIEAEAIRRALEQNNGCRKQAAKMLGISTRTMQRRVKELNM
jgi:two-component system nitrogen regulation response regulator GlnG